MTGAAFVLAINVSAAGLLAAAFVGIAVYDRTRTSARWFALAYGLAALNFLLEFSIPLLPVARAGAFLAFAATLATFTAGVARLYDARVPRLAIACVLVAALVLWPVIDSMPREDFVRQMLYQAPYAAMQAIGAVIIWRHGPAQVPDRALALLVTLTAAHYPAKPFIARAAGGVGDSPQAYMHTLYALFSQSIATILGLAVALTLLTILLRGVLTDAIAQSRTDKLSGLLNRRGFEERRDWVMRGHTAGDLPVSLVLCDLDRFKQVNDIYGHASGDRVIQAFARLLEQTLGPHHHASRIGGEEFAVLLPGSNLAAARIVAEGIRSAFSHAEVDGVPDDARLTASFGVAERQPGETAEELFRRADNALYDAKRGGRDRVCLSLAPHGGRSAAASA